VNYRLKTLRTNDTSFVKISSYKTTEDESNIYFNTYYENTIENEQPLCWSSLYLHGGNAPNTFKMRYSKLNGVILNNDGFETLSDVIIPLSHPNVTGKDWGGLKQGGAYYLSVMDETMELWGNEYEAKKIVVNRSFDSFTWIYAIDIGLVYFKHINDNVTCEYEAIGANINGQLIGDI
jgi:hypothetical protein